MRRSTKSILGFLAAIILLGACLGSAEASLPGNTLISARDGSEAVMSAWQGTPTLLVFFSPVCRYCRTELKELEKLARWPIGQGVRIVAVAPGGFSDRVLDAVVSKWELNRVEVYSDPGNALFKAFRVKKVPYTVYFDPDGSRKDGFLGAANASELEEFLKEQQL
jgi:thiol-disulfide isomerase/thioredoxin